MFERLSRLRKTPALRALFCEITVSTSDLIYPLFVTEAATAPEPIASMPGQFRWTLDALGDELERVEQSGVKAVLLFGIPAQKGIEKAYGSTGIVQKAIELARKTDLVVMTDVCTCSSFDHGHCGVIENGQIDNDATLEILAKIAVSHAQAGAHVVAPSSMMDGQVWAIREALDAQKMQDIAIMGYSAKFASAFYGPFREAADSAPSFGDRASYQHDAANTCHSRREILADEAEGADILMVKPGLAYLDLVKLARETSDLPIAAYNVSGEYSMVKAASERGWLDEKKVVLETMTAFKRAGADLIITYHAKDVANWLTR